MAHSLINKVQSAVQQSWSEHCSDHFKLTVALSGGVDSVVLLHALIALQDKLPKLKLTAIHVHHGLQDEADDWVVFCRQLCGVSRIRLQVVYATVDAAKLGVEAAARQERYRAYEQSKSSIIALAQHQDDQDETLLLAMLRGGSIAALAAMPTLRPLNSKQFIWRPLLSFSKAQLLSYAKEAQLDFVTDPSNHNTDYLRNWVRNEWLPSLALRLPHYSSHLHNTISHCQDALRLQQEIEAEDLAMVMQSGVFDLLLWCKLSETRRNIVLLAYIKQLGYGSFSQAQFREFTKILFKNPHKYVKMKMSFIVVFAYQGRLWFHDCDWLQKIMQTNQMTCVFDGVLPKSMQDIGFTVKCQSVGIHKDILQEGCFIRAATPNDKIHLPFGHKSVFKFLQEQRVPPHLRGGWPIVVTTQQACVAICNGPVAVDFQQRGGLCLKNSQLQSFMLNAMPD